MANILSEETERRAIALVRTVANRCTTCLHKNYENCKRCLSSWANDVMKDYEVDLATAGRPGFDYTLGYRVKYILNAIYDAGHPLRSRDIDTRDLCTKQLKRWTMRHMVSAGMLVRTVGQESNAGSRSCYLYDLSPAQRTRMDEANAEGEDA